MSGSRILQGRVSIPSVRDTGGPAPKGVDLGGGCAPPQKNFCISYIKMLSFCAFSEIFIDTVTALPTCFEHVFF